MADDAWKRFFDKQKRAEKAGAANNTARARAEREGTIQAPVVKRTPDQSEETLKQISTLIDQLSHLYNMYLQDVEQRPPVEKRKQLETLMNQITAGIRGSTQERFRASVILQQAQTKIELWDKQLHKLESGEIVRKQKRAKV